MFRVLVVALLVVLRLLLRRLSHLRALALFRRGRTRSRFLRSLLINNGLRVLRIVSALRCRLMGVSHWMSCGIGISSNNSSRFLLSPNNPRRLWVIADLFLSNLNKYHLSRHDLRVIISHLRPNLLMVLLHLLLRVIHLAIPSKRLSNSRFLRRCNPTSLNRLVM